jgi:hypothetical protein
MSTTPKIPKKPTSNNSEQSPEEFVIEWMKTFVEVPHPAFGGMPPCPYAQQARIKNKVQFYTLADGEPDSNIWTRISDTNFDKVDVLVVISPATRFTADQAHEMRQQLNDTFLDDDIVVLEDHPKQNEIVAGVAMSNGKYCLYLVQKRSKLNRFSNALKKTSDYYKNWTAEQLDEVVNWRDPSKSRP